MTPVIRPAESGDVDGLLTLIRRHAIFERSSALLGREALWALLRQASPPTHLLVAERPQGLAGYAAVTFDYSLWRGAAYAHLDCLFVEEACRSQGLGKDLLSAAVDLARRQGSDRLEWQTPDWNDNAIRFYMRQGATAQSKMRFSLEWS